MVYCVLKENNQSNFERRRTITEMNSDIIPTVINGTIHPGLFDLYNHLHK